MKTMIWIAILLLVVSSSAFGASGPRCVYPVADSGGAEPSKPSLEGRIVRVEKGTIDVRLQSRGVTGTAKTPTRVRIDDKTKIFTVYGGYVGREEFAVGQHVYVWYINCEADRGGSPILAAVVQLELVEPDK